MRIFTVLGIFFYTTVLSLIGGMLIMFSLNWLPVQDIAGWLGYLQINPQARFVLGLTGLLLILISISLAQLILGKLQRERTIAFANPSGQVTISLSAVEDLIVRLIRPIPEIKEVRPDVIAGKRGIEIDLRVVLKSEVNIPDLTIHLQELVKNKVQEILGIEEQIIVRIHVLKIVSLEDKERKKKETEKEEAPTVPFSGYR